MTWKPYSLLKMLTFFLLVIQISAKPSALPSADASKHMLNKLKSLFKVGDEIVVYNTGITSEWLEGDEIVCPERIAGKTYCKKVENYTEATRLDKIDPEKFDDFEEYFKNDLKLPQVMATRMDFGNSTCNSKTKVIYPEGAMSKDAQWLFVVQHEQYKQGVRIEECENEVRPGEENSTLPLEDISTSKQNFSYRKMVVLVNGKMTKKMVKLPYKCECIM